jgi:hypothetical protein
LSCCDVWYDVKIKQSPWPLVRKRITRIEWLRRSAKRPEPLLFHSRSSSVILTRLNGPVPDSLLLRKFGSVGNRTRDLCIRNPEDYTIKVAIRCQQRILGRTSSSGMLRRVTFVRTDVSEERSYSIIRVTRIGELGTLVVTSNRRTLRRNASVTAMKTSNLTNNIMFGRYLNSRNTMLQPGRSRVRNSIRWMILINLRNISYRIRPISNINEHNKIFLVCRSRSVREAVFTAICGLSV